MDSHGAIAASPPRFRCRAVSWRRAICDGPGALKIRPTELLPIGGSVTLAFLYCNRCCWEIDQVQLRQPPWSISWGPATATAVLVAAVLSNGTFTGRRGGRATQAREPS